MRKEGAIGLGTGGDNSNGAQGNLFEGVMTAAYSSDAADDAVQANIVSVYGQYAMRRVLRSLGLSGVLLAGLVSTPAFAEEPDRRRRQAQYGRTQGRPRSSRYRC